MAAVSCESCREFVYKIPEGTLQEYEGGDGEMLPVLRYGSPTPCEQCPKGGPENEAGLTLMARNRRAWDIYERLVATRGAYVVPSHLRECELFSDNMRMVEMAIKHGEAEAKLQAYESAKKDAENGGGSGR